MTAQQSLFHGAERQFRLSLLFSQTTDKFRKCGGKSLTALFGFGDAFGLEVISR
jgi:hypothetical protein